MKKNHLYAIGAAVIVVFIVFFVKSSSQKNKELKKFYDEIELQQENEGRILNELESLGWDMDQTCVERLIPMSMADKDGNSLTYWNYSCTRPELREGSPSIYIEVFDPDTAESSRSVFIDDESGLTGTIYQKNGRSYLLWIPTTDVEEHILLIDYDPDTVAESEIIKMAASCN